MISVLFCSDASELVSKVEDLEYQNRRLSDENLKLSRQLESSEEACTQKDVDMENMQKKIIR